MYTGNMNTKTITLAGGDHIYIQEKPTFTTVWCPEIGYETARDGFCFSCGSTTHEVETD